MSNLFNEQDYLDNLLSANPLITEHPCIEPLGSGLEWLIAPSQMNPDAAFTSGVLHKNALGLSGMSETETVWVSDLFSSATETTSYQIDTQSFDTPFSDRFPLSDSVAHLWQQPTSYHPSVHEDGALYGAEGGFTLHAIQPVARRETHSAWEPTTRSVSASRSPVQPSCSPRSPRHAPYPMGLDNVRRRTSTPSLHQCQWLDGAGSCGELVAGTKNAIGEHLLDAHATRLKADKTFQVCHWQGCRKKMRRESIARHILAVHMRDKVLCPGCGSRFARMDSQQRHQRTQCPAREEVSGSKEGE